MPTRKLWTSGRITSFCRSSCRKIPTAALSHSSCAVRRPPQSTSSACRLISGPSRELWLGPLAWPIRNTTSCGRNRKHRKEPGKILGALYVETLGPKSRDLDTGRNKHCHCAGSHCSCGNKLGEVPPLPGAFADSSGILRMRGKLVSQGAKQMGQLCDSAPRNPPIERNPPPSGSLLGVDSWPFCPCALCPVRQRGDGAQRPRANQTLLAHVDAIRVLVLGPLAYDSGSGARHLSPRPAACGHHFARAQCRNTTRHDRALRSGPIRARCPRENSGQVEG